MFSRPGTRLYTQSRDIAGSNIYSENPSEVEVGGGRRQTDNDMHTSSSLPGRPGPGTRPSNKKSDNTNCKLPTQQGDIPLWKSSDAKNDLVSAMQDPNSAIRKMSIEDIYRSDPKYFSCYEYRNFYQNVKSLEKKYNVQLPKNIVRRKKGGTSKAAYNSEGKKVKGWGEDKAKGLLLALLLDKKSAIHTQTSDAIYTSHKSFQQFERKYFLDNLKNLRVIAAAKAKHIEATESAFHLEQLAHPPNQLTARGYPRWPGHPAQSMLKEDVESGLANTLKPAQLRAKRSEYKGFPSDVFRGHIHQEKRAQREADFWIPKRNKDAQRKRDKEAKELKKEWEKQYYNEEVYAED